MSAFDKIKAKISAAAKKPQTLTELDLADVEIKKITPEIKTLLEKCKCVEILIMSGCKLDSLENFPKLGLTAIDLSNNNLGDEALTVLAEYKEIGQLLFTNNQIQKLDSLAVLKALTHLQEVDFTDNPVTKADNYRTFLFDNVESLEIIDRTDKDGNQIVDEEEFQDDEDDDDEEEFDEDDEDEYDEEEESSEKPKKKRK